MYYLQHRTTNVPVEVVHWVACVARHLEQASTGFDSFLYLTPVSMNFVI